MAAATIQAQVYHGATGAPSLASAEGGVVWNRSDDELAVQRVPVPAAIPGSNYSNYKSFVLVVTVIGTTTISNFAYRRGSLDPSGGRFFALLTAPSSYTQCSGSGGTQGNRPPDSTAPLASSPDPNTPTGYTPVLDSASAYDTSSYSTGTTGAKGKILQVCYGLSHLYGGNPSAAEPLPSLVISYDES